MAAACALSQLQLTCQIAFTDLPVQIHVALHPHPQGFPRLRIRYFHCHHHVNHLDLVKRNLRQLSQNSRRLCRRSFQRWKVVVCRLHYFLFFAGAWTCYHRIAILPNTPISWRTKATKPRRSSLVETFLMRSQISWPTTTTPFVSWALSAFDNDLNSCRILWSLLLFRSYQ